MRCRHRLPLLALLALLAPVAAPAQTAAPAAPRPNIVLIVVDDMGWADLGCYGSRAIRTPHADRLAAEGMRFTDAYSGCTVCAPARSTLMTGMHMGHTSVRGNSGGIPLLDEDVTLAEVLAAAGYATGGFGKWGLGDLGTSGAAEKQGFDRFFGYYHQIHAHFFYPEYLISDGRHFPLPGNAGYDERHAKNRPRAAPATEAGRRLEFSAERIFAEMKRFVRSRAEAGERFFCYAPWTPPHAQYHLPADDPAWKLYADKPWPMDARVHAAFCSMVDRHLGETLALLDELGIADDTLVMFASDNGASRRFEGTLDSSGPLAGFKRSMHEGGIRVPLIARWPGAIAAGTTSDLPTYFPDFLPTLAELAGATEHVPEGIDGLSIAPTLLGRGEQARHEFLYWEYMRKWAATEDGARIKQAIRKGRWKMLHDGGGKWRLHDLETDLGETRDVAGDHPEVVAELAWLAAGARRPMRRQVEPRKPKGKKYR